MAAVPAIQPQVPPATSRSCRAALQLRCLRPAPRRGSHSTVAQTPGNLLARGHVEDRICREFDAQTSVWWLIPFLVSGGFRTATISDRGRLEVELGAMVLGDSEDRPMATKTQRP